MPNGHTASAGGPAAIVAGARSRRGHLTDVAARWVVSAGGLATIASILGMLLVFCYEVYPLWLAPRAEVVARVTLPSDTPLLAGIANEYRTAVVGVTPEGALRSVNLADGKVIAEVTPPELAGRRPSLVARAGADVFLLGTEDGSVVGVRSSFATRRAETRVEAPTVKSLGVWTLPADAVPPRLLVASPPPEAGITLVAAGSGAPQLLSVSERKSLFGAATKTETARSLPLPEGAAATALAISADSRRVFVGTDVGLVQYWELRDPSQPVLMDTVEAAPHGTAITALQVLIGNQSVAVGDKAGRVNVWFPVRDALLASGWRLQRVHQFGSHSSPITAIAASARNRSFLAADEAGSIGLYFSTNGRTLLQLAERVPGLVSLAFAPKADGATALDTQGALISWDIENPHPEITAEALFGKVWYEGYEEPAYVWQSTGGTDDFEPKLSLIPLIFGTAKGTLYALLFAVPMAVLAALYTSQFTHPTLRNLIKPTVEIMAALPSVVLGFLAGLWLAPLIEGVVPAVLAALVVVPISILATATLWHLLGSRARRWVSPGMEALILVPVIALAVAACLHCNDAIARLLFGGDFRTWLPGSLGLRYDQRNCLVVGFAMGFAVIPLIFTISEDALSNVPTRLVSGSLALGATRWQTALRVVLPTASPGIFSAIMVGFGRAVGETMIVLMATGNTPVMDWNLFTGIRTLSANIAVEIPEAPQGDTLYRILFLSALLLFGITFIVNTAAELVRLRLRKRYQQL